MSVKDLFDQKGLVSRVGCATNSKNAGYDATAILPIIGDGGAITLIRGNVSQGAMSIHTHNKIWGTSLNFYDKTRSCGGSSGGDAGLVASRCVPLAIGSDIGGSLRIPAHFNGVVSFKPSNRRITYKGGSSPRFSKFDILSGHMNSIGGPLAHSVNDCIEFFKL